MSVEIRGKIFNVKEKKGSSSLNLKFKKISDINEIKNLDSLSDLQKLNLNRNDITELKGLDNLINLHELDLSSNKIAKISNLEQLTNLRVLHLQKNNISKIEGLGKLTLLEELDLRSNMIKEIENLENLKNLKILRLDGNPCYKEFKLTFVGNGRYNIRYYNISKELFDKGILYYAKQPLETRKKFVENGKITIDKQKYLGMKMSEIAQKVEKYLEDNYLNEKHIYYPVEATPIFERISDFMKKDEVIYSTLCNFNYFNAVTNKRANWQSQLLISKNGVSYFLPKGSGIVYQDWKYVNYSKPKMIQISPNKKVTEVEGTMINFIAPKMKKLEIYGYSLIRDSQFESEQSFNNRKKEFRYLCILLWARDLFKNPPLEYFEYHNLLLFLESRYLRKIMDYLFKDTIHLID